MFKIIAMVISLASHSIVWVGVGETEYPDKAACEKVIPTEVANIKTAMVEKIKGDIDVRIICKPTEAIERAMRKAAVPGVDI